MRLGQLEILESSLSVIGRLVGQYSDEHDVHWLT